MKLEYSGTVTNGVFKMRNRKLFDEGLKRFEGEVEGVLYKKKVVRSDNQNRWYWKCIVDPCWQGLRDTGNDYSKAETHEFLKTNFNYTEVVNEDTGEVLRYVKSTARLTKSEFSEYVEKIIRFAAEYLNVVIENPK